VGFYVILNKESNHEIILAYRMQLQNFRLHRARHSSWIWQDVSFCNWNFVVLLHDRIAKVT